MVDGAIAQIETLSRNLRERDKDVRQLEADVRARERLNIRHRMRMKLLAGKFNWKNVIAAASSSSLGFILTRNTFLGTTFLSYETNASQQIETGCSVSLLEYVSLSHSNNR